MDLSCLNQNKEKGAIATLLTIIILAVILVIGLALLSVFATEFQSSSYLKQSTPAYYAAESGAEYALYQIMNGYPQNPGGVGNPDHVNLSTLSDAYFDVEWDANLSQGAIKSIGSYRNIKRKVEVDF